MSERPFVCTPSAWNTDSILNAVSDDAELIFTRVGRAIDKNWRLPVEEDAPAHSIRLRCFEPMRRYRSWNVNRIDRGLAELLAAGLLVRLFQNGRCWLQIAERLQYHKGANLAELQAPPEQSELPMLTEMVAPDLPGIGVSPPLSTGIRAAGFSGIPSRRVEDGDKKRVLGKKKELPASCGTVEEELLDQVAQACGIRERLNNGGLWRTRIRENTRALRHALEAFQVLTPEQRNQIKNRAAWLTDQYARCCAELEQARHG